MTNDAQKGSRGKDAANTPDEQKTNIQDRLEKVEVQMADSRPHWSGWKGL